MITATMHSNGEIMKSKICLSSKLINSSPPLLCKLMLIKIALTLTKIAVIIS